MKCESVLFEKILGKGLKNLLKDYDWNEEQDFMISRHMQLAHFLKMLEEKKNVLTHVSTWEDPFEGLIFHSKYVDKAGNPIDSSKLYSRYYGQCWTIGNADTELQWKARTSDGYGVCLKSTASCLLETLLKKGNGDFKHCIVGKISYKKRSSIEKLVKSMGAIHDRKLSCKYISSNDLIEFFFVKRVEFSDEKELRVVLDIGEESHRNNGAFQYQQGGYGMSGIVKYDINMNEFVQKVVLDPRMPEDMEDFVKQKCRDCGCTVDVCRSDLYTYIGGNPTIRIYR